MNQTQLTEPITAIIGLGNPGSAYARTRHNIGFQVVDELAQRYGGSWRSKDNSQQATIVINDQNVHLVKPMTGMNVSGQVLSALFKRGIKPENILVVHDELEMPFGKVAIKVGGSHKGHNGVRSIIAAGGATSPRLHVGIGRPEHKEDVPDYVLKPFDQPESAVQALIDTSADVIEKLFQKN